LSIIVDGEKVSTPASFPWLSTERHTVSGPLQPGAQTGTRYQFDHWNDIATNDNPRLFTNLTSAATYTLNFTPQYQVSVQVVPSLWVSVRGVGCSAGNATTTLQATPAQGFAFASYSGGVNSTTNPQPITVTGPLQVTTTFKASQPPVLYASAGARVDL